jgi:hypothetical protein
MNVPEWYEGLVQVSEKGIKSLSDDWKYKYIKYNLTFPITQMGTGLVKGGGKMKDVRCMLAFFRIKPPMC